MAQRIALVTGATGGLGRHVVAKLAAGGYAVRATGRNRQIGNVLATSPAVTFVAGDLESPALVRELVDGADVVFHCAALSAPWGPRTRFHTANVVVTQTLVDAARAAGSQRMVHVSTPSLTFRFRDQLAIREDDPLPPRFVNHYAATKAQAEAVVRAAARDTFAVTIVRPRGIFGEFDTVLIPRLLEVARGGTMPVFDNGDALVDVTYAGNVADAKLLCDRPGAPSGTFNITNGEPLTVRDLLVRAFRVLGRDVTLRPASYGIASAIAGSWELAARALRVEREPRLLRYSLGLMRYSQTLDISAARGQLGYAPHVSIDEGLQRFSRWLENGRPDWFTGNGTQTWEHRHAGA